MKLVGVHGVRNFRPGMEVREAATDIAQVWCEGLEQDSAADSFDVDLRIAYYADLLHAAGQQGAEFALDQPGEAALRQWIALQSPPEAVAMGAATLPLHVLLEWFAASRGLDQGLVAAFLQRFFAEVSTYFSVAEPERRIAARSRVADAILDHRPRVLLAHSLGSVVALEALWADSDLTVELLVTAGSPLAMPDVVLDRLECSVRSRPPGVQRWVNIVDKGDLVATPARLASAFEGVDDIVTSIHWADFHKISNYLRCEPMGRTLASISRT